MVDRDAVGICRELSLFSSILNMFQAEFGSVCSQFINVFPNSDKSVLKLSQFVLLYTLIGRLGWKGRPILI